MHDTIFDPRFYSQHHGLGDRGTWAQFQAEGDAAGLDPCPYFATLFYKERYPDWQDRGARTALEDFCQRIRRGEMRQPHPLLDPVWYLARYPDLAALGAGAALHFMQHGDYELRSPSAGFDAGFYQRCYLALDQREAFRHYITQGRALGLLPRPEPRGAVPSAAAMAQALTGLTAKGGRPILIGVHDAQRAGVPLLALDLAAALEARGWQPVFLLHRAGPLIDRFRARAPVFILSEGWDLGGLVQALPAAMPVLITTAAAADMAPACASAGHRCLVLSHEMADYLRAQGLLAHLAAAQRAGAQVIASMPPMAAALAPDLGPLEVLRPGIVLPPTPQAAFRRLRRWRKAQPGPVYISAGHADRRKGFDLFLAVAVAIHRRQPEARFVWLGALDDWARGLAEAALRAGLPLTLPGFVAESLAWYRAADVYLLTSRQDPGPTTVIHAAALGTPFVGYAADIGILDMTEGIGVFVAPDRAEEFVQTALRLAAAVSPRSRRDLRRHIRAETALAPYVDGLLARLSPA